MPLKHSVEEITLKNGARGLLIDTPTSTSVYYSVRFLAGINYVKDTAKSQTAHIMEHMAFGANSKFKTAEKFSQEFSKNGAWNNALTSNIEMNYYSSAPLMEWDRILDLQLLSITQPRYSQEALDAEKGNVREELTGYAANHGRILWQEIMKAFGLERWYDPKEIETIAPVTLEDIKAHFKHTHATCNMRFVVAGNLKAHRDEIVKKLEAMELPSGEAMAVPTETAQAPGPVFVVRKDVPSLIFSLTFFINRSLSFEEQRALSVLSHVLTGTFHSRILGEARRRGICYGMGTSYESSPTGVTELSIGGQVQFKNAAELSALVIEQLNQVKEHGITEAELAAAKEYRVGGLQMSNDTTRSVAGWYMEDYYETGIIDPLDKAAEHITKTTVADVQKLLNEFIDTGIWTFAGLGNATPKEFSKLYTMFEKELINKVQ